MKPRVLFNVFLALVLVMFCLPVAAQPSTKSVETILIDEFDDPAAVDWTWKTNVSRFATEGYPKIAYVNGVPNSLKPFRASDAPQAKVLGIKSAFGRKGDNWFEVYPSKKNDKGEDVPFEILLKGKVDHFDFWVWGANYKYTLDILVRDGDGCVCVIPVGLLNFNGWKNFVIKIPRGVRQESRLRSGPKNLTFIGFRVKTDPTEYVDDFVIYFDNFKYSTNTLNNIFDGFELKHVDFDSPDSGTGR